MTFWRCFWCFWAAGGGQKILRISPPPWWGGNRPILKGPKTLWYSPSMVGGESPDFWDLSPPMMGGDNFFWRSVPPHHGGGIPGCFESPPMERDSRSGILEAEAWAQSEVSKQAKSVPPHGGGGERHLCSNCCSNKF